MLGCYLQKPVQIIKKILILCALLVLVIIIQTPELHKVMHRFVWFAHIQHLYIFPSENASECFCLKMRADEVPN